MKNMTLDRTVKQYILDAISNEGYDDAKELVTEAEKLDFLAKTFIGEYSYAVDRLGASKAFADWIMGLPSSFNIDFENYKILELAKAWGSIPADATERQKDKILENWFNFITVKTFQLFRKHHIAI